MKYEYNEEKEDLFFDILPETSTISLYDDVDEFSFVQKDMSSTDDESDVIKKTKTPSKSSNSKIKSIHKDHRKRVREKFFKFGLECFSEYEVLEFLLFHSIPLKDTNEIAHKLIEHFGSLEGVLNAEYYDLMEVAGISEVSAGLITLHRQISKYIRVNNRAGVSLDTSRRAGQFCCDYFLSHVEENFIIIILDENKNAIAVEVISEGSETETALYPRKIIKSIIKHRGTKVIIAHNHPNQNPYPSNSDKVTTSKLAQVLNEFDIQLIDHIVCGGQRYISMSERGMIQF